MTAGPPLISCLMVTRGNLFPARFAVRAYRAQDWPNRELVIVCDAPAVELRAYLEGLADPTIRFVETEKAPLGALRNASVASARGTYVAQWDDDDLFAADRLRVQAEALIASGGDALFLERWMMWWPDRLRLAISGRRWWEGTMLARKDVLPPYPAIARLEDTRMVEILARQAHCRLLDRPDLYCYVIHGRNTWDRKHFEAMFTRATTRFEFADYEPALACYSPRFPFAAYEEGLET